MRFDTIWILRGVLLLLSYLLYLYAWNTAFASESTAPQIVSLKGYLGKEELNRAVEEIEKANHILILQIDSSSADLPAVLDAAKKIYELKQEKKLFVIAYIEGNAIGPAAIFPFLADDLFISLFVSWGDIPLGNEKVLSTNLLRNRILSLVDRNNPHADLLRLLATAMSDPTVEVTDEGGWKLTKEGATVNHPISPKGQTLVINQVQIQELGLVSEPLSAKSFLAKFVSVSPESNPTLEGKPISPTLLETNLQKYIKYSESGPNHIGHLIIDDRTSGINQSTWLYIKNGLDYYKNNKPIFLILELNTPGGEVFAAQKISDALKDLDTQFNIPVVCYINNWAISAGAMLAYSCRFIAVVKDASMGAAEPILQDTSTGKTETASEKVNSALRADFANRASFFDRDPNLAEAMVDKDIILVQRHGKITKLDNESQIRTTGPDPDILISPKGKLLTLNAEQMIRFGVADILLLPTKTELITEGEREAGKWPADKMALFQQPFFKEIPNATVDAYVMDWKTRFFVLLTHPIVSSLLFLGLMLGFYLEMNTPGFGVAGTVALTCLILIILSSFSLELANWLELILLITGLIIVGIELFVLPSFGLLGFIGIIFFIVGLFGMMLPGIDSIHFELDTKTWNAAGEAFFHRLAWLSGTLVVAFLLILLIGRFVAPKFSKYNRLILSGNEQSGFIAGEDPKDLPQPGAKGEVIATLRPTGKIMVNDAIYDAISNGSFIEKGESIVVSFLDGSVIVVEKAPEENDKF